MCSISSDYINEVLQESENDGDGTKSTSKEDWDSAITFTARTSRECSCIVAVTCFALMLLRLLSPITVCLLWESGSGVLKVIKKHMFLSKWTDAFWTPLNLSEHYLLSFCTSTFPQYSYWICLRTCFLEKLCKYTGVCLWFLVDVWIVVIIEWILSAVIQLFI